LDRFIADAVATSDKYWIASLLIGAVLMGLEAYQKRWSIILVLTIALLVFHPHLTVHPFPTPSCEFASVQDSQVVTAVLAMMLAYRVVKMFVQRAMRRVHQHDG
jgi:predicted cobalt transporter CbtA